MTTRRIGFLLALIFCCWPLAAAELPLTPYPQKVQMGTGELVTKSTVTIAVDGNNADDHFAATQLADDLKSIDGVTAEIKTRASGSPRSCGNTATSCAVGASSEPPTAPSRLTSLALS